MDGKRKFSGGYPSVDQFYSILQKISPQTKFTESAIKGLREIYLAYIREVSSSLAQWDSLKEEDKIIDSLNVNLLFEEFTTKAKELLRKNSTNSNSSSNYNKPTKKRKKQKLTAEDAAEQERLLEQSKKYLQDSKAT